MSTDTMAGTPATEFSEQELAALRERREAVSNQWVDAVRGEAQTKEGKVSLEAGLSTETQERVERYQREYETLSATIRTHETAKEQANLVKAEEDLTSSAPKYRDLQAKAEAKFFENLMAVGQGQFKRETPVPVQDTRSGAHPGSLDIPTPLIAMNPATGKNEVHPFPAVFPKEGEDRSASVEASFRNAEMIAADKFGQYDPLTGNRLSAHAAPVGRQMEAELGFGITNEVADPYLRQGGMLYQYEIDRNELARYMDIKQVPFVNDFLIDRRTGIGSAVPLINEAGQMAVIDSTFDTLTITPRKFGHLRGMTYEASRIMEPWSVAQTIMTDAGIAMGNRFGELVVTGRNQGTNMNQEWQGLKNWASESGNANNQALGAHGTFLVSGGTNTFGIFEMAQFLTRLDKQYFRAPGKLLSMKLGTWGRLQGVENTRGDKLFKSSASLEEMMMPEYNLRVVLDENWDDPTAATSVPFFYGDFKSACYVMYGPVRVDFSSEHGFTTDRLYWRFVAHRSFQVVDPNGFYGGMTR